MAFSHLHFILFIVYLLAWWLVFWLPLRKTVLAALCFIPAAICAFGIPMIVSDVYFSTLRTFLVVWAALPFGILLVELGWSAAGRKRSPRSNHVGQGGLQ